MNRSVEFDPKLASLASPFAAFSDATEQTSREHAPTQTGRLDEGIARALSALLAMQREDGHGVFELEADVTISAEYVVMRHYLGEPIDSELEARMGRYLRRRQQAGGGWPLFEGGAIDVSASVKAYFALNAIGDDPHAPHMQRACAAIRAHGGAAASNVFTRLLLALFDIMPWRAVPAMPVEIMLLPSWFPFHLSKVLRFQG